MRPASFGRPLVGLALAAALAGCAAPSPVAPIATAAAPCAAVGGDGVGAIEVTVNDTNGNLVADVLVEARRVKSRAVPPEEPDEAACRAAATAKTAAGGVAKLPGLPAGIWYLRVAGSDHHYFFDVAAGQTATRLIGITRRKDQIGP